MKKLIIISILLCSCNPRLSGSSYPISVSYWEWQYSINTKTNQKIDKQGVSRQLKFGDYAATTVFYENKVMVSSYETKSSLGECCQGTDDYIFKANDGQSFRVIITLDRKSGKDVTLRMSNLMQGEYSEKLDSITHYYIPIAKFD